MAHERAKARTLVMRDGRLSSSARVVYSELDENGGNQGIAWYEQTELARVVGLSRRTVQDSLKALSDLGYIRRRERHRSYTRYHLYWSDRQKTADQKAQNLRFEANGESAKFAPVKRKICASETSVSLYASHLFLAPSTIEVGQSVGSSPTTPPPQTDRPTDPPPIPEEPTNLEDRLLVGLVTRELPTDSYMTNRVAAILETESCPADFFLIALDRKLARKHRLRQPYDLAWLPQAARDAVSTWRNQRRVAEWRRARAQGVVA